jgi:hypothetical protein
MSVISLKTWIFVPPQDTGTSQGDLKQTLDNWSTIRAHIAWRLDLILATAIDVMTVELRQAGRATSFARSLCKKHKDCSCCL